VFAAEVDDERLNRFIVYYTFWYFIVWEFGSFGLALVYFVGRSECFRGVGSKLEFDALSFEFVIFGLNMRAPTTGFLASTHTKYGVPCRSNYAFYGATFLRCGANSRSRGQLASQLLDMSSLNAGIETITLLLAGLLSCQS
jgi:hypothetical protein